MQFKAIDVSKLELGQVCYDASGVWQDKFIFCGISENTSWFYPITEAEGYGKESDGTVGFSAKNSLFYEEV